MSHQFGIFVFDPEEFCVVLFRLCGEILEVQNRSSAEEVRDLEVIFVVFLSHKFKKPKFRGGI